MGQASAGRQGKPNNFGAFATLILT
jgi:hypothetical protein